MMWTETLCLQDNDRLLRLKYKCVSMDVCFQALQQEKHMLQRHLEVRELEAGQREAELQADISSLRQQFDQKHNQVQLLY